MKLLVLFCMLAAFGIQAVNPPPASPEAAAIARKIDELYRSDSSRSLLEMEIVTPHWSRTLEMKVWTVGTDQTFVRILSPKKEQGVGTLRIGNEMWNYFPRVNKVVKVPPSMMMGSWMGSDFTNDDLVREFTLTEDYHFARVTPPDAREEAVYLEAKPKREVPVVWARILISVRQKDLLPLRQEYYSEKGELIRRIDFSGIKNFGRRAVPAVMELVPAKKTGYKTVLRYKSIEFDVPIDGGIMTLRHLRSGG